MIRNVFKGMIIGLANIIPGVSGGTMAVSMGIYDRLIHCISHLFSEFRKNIAFLAPLAVGMVLAIIASSFGIDFLFERFPVQTNLLFIGLILGSLPAVYKKVKLQPVGIGHIVAAVIFFGIVVGMALLKGASGREISIEINFVQLLLLFVVGVIASATMVIPGVSGSMMLLLLGYYNPILDTIKSFALAVAHLDMPAVLQTLLVLAPFGIGVLVGIAVIAKVIEAVFKRFPLYAYWSIIGLLVASPLAILLLGSFPKLTAVRVITGILTFVLGWVISVKLGEQE